MASQPERVRSADGTEIAFERAGEGPLVVVVGGAFSDRASFAGLVDRLRPVATVVCYDRRGRGASGDRRPHRVADEVADLLALCAAVGPPELVYGHSSGGLLALAACAAGLTARRVCVYEPPFQAGEWTGRLGPGFAERLGRLAEAGRRAEAVTAFLTEGTGMGPAGVERLRRGPSWAAMEALAHTLAYDVALCAGPEAVGDGIVGAIASPVLVAAGGASRGGIRMSAEELARRLPDARLAVLEGQVHVVSSAVLAPVLERLLGEAA